MKGHVDNSALVLWRMEHALLTLEDLASTAGLHPELVATYVSYGLLEPDAENPDLFPFSTVERLRCIVRLRRDLGVNLAGIAVILQMRDQIKALQHELERLRRSVSQEV
jgi:MerR family transcriptional regulator/heat shock protein HspR